MSHPKDLVEKAKYEVHVFERVSSDTGIALIAEIERLRAAMRRIAEAAHVDTRHAPDCDPALAAVRDAVRGYYAALDRREHGGVAQDRAFRAIEQALGMQWVQGASLMGLNG